MSSETSHFREEHPPPQLGQEAEVFSAAELLEQTQELDVPAGKGYVAHWQVEGICMHYARWHYHAPYTAAWHTDQEAVHLHFNLRGRTALENHRTGTTLALASAEHNVYFCRGVDGLIRHEELESETFRLQLHKPAFLALVGQDHEPLRRFGTALLRGEDAVLSPRSLPLSLALHTAIREVLSCPFAGPLKKLFLYAKALELVALQAHAIEQHSQAPRRYARTDYDRERLLFARDFLLEHRALPPSLPELARVAGLNEFKLKKGFKELFGYTVFGYLSEQRLADAKAQLQERRKTASELAFELGYSSVQHFSAAFKKKFGVSPTQLRG